MSCVSTNACTAAGFSIEPYHPARPYNTKVALVERWNGKRWAIQRVPMPAGGTSSNLTGVSCASETTCIAVGSYDLKLLAERWKG